MNRRQKAGCGVVKALSDDFSYLHEWALRYGRDWRWWAAHQRVEQNAIAKVELAAAHDAICQREDGLALRQYLSQSRADGGMGQGDKQAAAEVAGRDERGLRGLRGLLRLLSALGRRGVQPFDGPVLQMPARRRMRVSSAKQPQTTTVAPVLRRLVRAARRLGIEPGHEALSRFVDHITPGQFNCLARMAHAIRRRLCRQPTRWSAQRARLCESDPDIVATLGALMHTLDALDIF